MGLIKAALGAAGGVLADQWKDFFICEEMADDVLVMKGHRSTGGRSSNTKGSDNVITNGSVIVVADGQCMMIVDQGEIVEVASEPGQYTFDSSTEPTIFSGNLGESIKQSFATMGKRFTFGAHTGHDQRVYFFNTRELMGNKYGTPSPIPFRVVGQRANIDIDIGLRCFGEYSYRIADPILFYKKIASSLGDSYTRDRIDSQLKSELLTALQPAFGKFSEQGVRYSALPNHTREIGKELNEILSADWGNGRGIEIVNFGISSVTPDEEDAKMIKELQRAATFTSGAHGNAFLTASRGTAMTTAAGNEGAGGAAMAFMGMNMADAAGLNAQNAFQMQQQQMQNQQLQQQMMQMQQQMQQMQNQQAAPQAAPAPAAAPAADGWTCPACGTAGITGKFCPECGGKKPEPKPAEGAWTCPACGTVGITGKFCPECGTKKPEQVNPDGWVCPSCSAVNKGKFCAECGTKKPEGVPKYQCDKCGWEPADPTKPPKFCPECGDPFDESDKI